MSIPITRILCPVDFSDGSRHALTHAYALARTYGSHVTVMHALAPPMYAADPLLAGAMVFTADDHDRVQRDLDAFARHEAGNVSFEAVVVDESPVPAILERAEALAVDLLVLGTHGRRGFERFVLGSTTERLLRRASCPVLTVPPQAPEAAAVGPVSYARIVCGVDFSPASLRALGYASRLAREVGAHLTLVNVVEPMPVPDALSLSGGASMDFEDAACAAMRTRLRDVAPTDLAVTEYVTVGKPYREILNRAQADHSHLIVIGVHGGAGALPGFLGSTTNHIVREATCPVLSLRA